MYSAVILAGGFGTRLKPMTDTVPKPMMPVFGEPNLVRLSELLCKNGFESAIVTVKYLGKRISDALGDYCRGVDLYYFFENEPLGTAGAVAAVKDLLEDDFIVISGDAVCTLDLLSAYEFHKSRDPVVTVVTHRVKDPLLYGTVVCDKEGNITAFCEKPSWSEVKSDLVNTGIYIASKRIFDFMDKDRPCDFSLDVFPKILSSGAPICAYEAEGYWRDIGSFSEYMKANLDLFDASGITKEKLPPGVDRSVTGEGFMIGKNSALINSVAFDGVNVGDNCSVVGCILCRNVTVGNGCVLRDGCVLGEGAVICDGVKLGANTVISPGRTVTENTEENALTRKKLFENGRIKFKSGYYGAAEICRCAYAVVSAVKDPVGVCFSADSENEAELFSRALSSAGGAVFGFGEVNDFAAAAAGSYFDCPVTVFADKSRDGRETVFSFFDRTGLTLTGSVEKKITAAFFSDPEENAFAGSVKKMTGLKELYYSSLSTLCDLSGASVSLYYHKESGDVSAALKSAGADIISQDLLYTRNGTFIINQNDGAMLLGQDGTFCSFEECLLILLSLVSPDSDPRIALPFFLPRIFADTAAARGIEVLRYLSKPDHEQSADREAKKERMRRPWTFDPLFCAVYLIFHLLKNGLSLSDAKEKYAGICIKHAEIKISPDEKAAVLRRLYEAYLPYQISAADGIAIVENGAEGMAAADDLDRIRITLASRDAEAADDAVAEIMERIGKYRS